MRKIYFLLITIILATVTIITAYHTSSQKVSRTVFAQSPQAVGCWQAIDETVQYCGCDGTSQEQVQTTLFVPGRGNGTNGYIQSSQDVPT